MARRNRIGLHRRSNASRPCPHQGGAVERLEGRCLLAAHIAGSTTVYSTIQAAVNAAAPGATITVDAGSYAELVNINKPLTLLGAQAGVDARSNTRAAAVAAGKETVVTGASLSSTSVSSPFYVTASDVTLDGFTVQGNTSAGTYGAGVVIAPNQHGTHVVNDIIRNNVTGLYLANNSSTDAAVIQHDVFLNNNNPGNNGGRGIYTDGGVSGGNLTNVLIDGNAFVVNKVASGGALYDAAISLESRTANSQSNITITNNVLDGTGKLLIYNASNITIAYNTVTHQTDQWSGTLRFEGGVTNATVEYNTVYDNNGPGVAIDAKGFPADDSGFVVTNNNFFNNNFSYGNKLSLAVTQAAYDGTLDARNNWWGNASGPGGQGPGTGDTVWGNAVYFQGANGQWSTAPGSEITYSPWSTAPNGSTERAYWGVPSSDGAPIQAEDFDHGGAGTGYSTPVAHAGSSYRPNEGIGIEATTDAGGGYDVNQTTAGEYLNYTVNLAQGGSYRLDFRMASAAAGATFHVLVDGQNVTGTLAVPNTGGTQVWQTVSKSGVGLAAGQHVVRIVFDTNSGKGNAGSLNWLQLTNLTPAPPPAAPSNLVASAASASQVNLTWQNNATNQGGFVIDRSGDGINFTTIATVGASVTSYGDTGLAAGTTYYYRVRATGVSGTSANSNVAVATTTFAASTSVYLSDLPWATATAGWGAVQKDASIKGNPVTLRGTVYAKGLGTHATSTITYNLNGNYNNFVSDVGIDDEVAGQGAADFQVIGDGKVLFDSGAVTGTSPVMHVNVNVAGVQQLTLQVNPAAADGGIDFDHADWAGAQLVANPGAPALPAAPTGLAAIASGPAQVSLTWKNNATNQSGFEVDRSTDGVNFTTVATTAANVTGYSDTGISAGTVYYYRVRATNAAGDSSNSNVAAATTAAANTMLTYLSSLTPTSASTGWGTVQNDASIKGNPLTLRGVTYARGVGTHADSTIVYNLGAKYATFVSDLGIDDEVGGQGSVDFQVLGDGKVLFDSGPLTGTSPGAHISVNVAGVQQLSLVVTTTTPGVIDYDHADWANAELLA